MREVLAQLRLPPEAVEFLLDVWTLVQGLDDWVDGDPVDRAAQDVVVWAALVKMPANGFLAANQAALVPLLASMVLKWKAADTVERSGPKDELPKAYVWRAGYYDVVLQTVLVVHGVDVAMAAAHEVLGMYGEKLGDYLKEFDGA